MKIQISKRAESTLILNNNENKYAESTPMNDGKDKRRRWLTNKLAKTPCICGEQQPHRLLYYPHQKRIRHLNLRYGLKHSSRKEIEQLILESLVMCWNCAADQKEDLSVFPDF